MVAIVAGNGLGLFNASNNILGNAGILGQGWLGQSNGRSYVNAATGNLILQGLDEQLSGRGADLLALRTYNSQGQLTGAAADGDADGGWHRSGERTVLFTAGASGEGRNVGGKVTRVGGDGHATDYAWNGTAYVSTEGDGAHDSLTYNTTSHQWTFVDGSTRQQEVYLDSLGSAPGQIIKQIDSTGNQIDFSYSSGLLATIVDHGSGQKIEFAYANIIVNGTQVQRVSQINTYSLNGPNGTLGAAVKEVSFAYNGPAGRLSKVTVDLTPTITTDSQVYVTNYTYDGTSGRIASITQTDGTSVNFTYEQIGATGVYRVKTVTDANGKQTFNYLSSTQTAIVISAADDSNAHTWTYTYDASTQQLLKIESPAVNGQRLSTTFEYEGTADGATHVGNLKRVTDGRGKTVTYGYDDRGNRTLERDSLGDTITRTFDPLTNQVLTETHYKSPDTTPEDNAPPADPLTTHFVYDGQARLRFSVSAEGRVMENRYGSATDGFGLLTRTIQYTANRYTGTDFSESALAGFVTNLSDKTQAQLTTYAYDLRGNLATRTDFATVNSSGEGVLDTATTLTEYIYDGYGELLKTLAVRGSGRTAHVEQTNFLYDGMNRETQRITSAGTQTTLYNGVGYGGDAKSIQVTTATGLVETRSFDNRGRLVSISQAGSGTTRQTKYFYTAQGQLALTLDALGGRRFSFYDAAGRLSDQVDSAGEVIGFTYNANGQLTAETHYANRLVGITDTADSNSITNSWLDNAGTPTKVTKTSFVVGTAGTSGIDLAIDTAKDRTTTYTYDDAERLQTRTDAAGTVTTTIYDGAARVTQQTTGDHVTDRVTKYFYDGDGKQVGVLDPLGYLTENKFDAAGQLVETVRYATRSPAAADVSAPVWVGLSDQTIVGGQPFNYRLYAVDADGDAVTYKLLSVTPNTPAWLTLDTSNPNAPFLKGTPPKTLTSYDIVVQADDGRGRTTNATVHITVANSPPKWEPLSDATVAANTAFSLQLPAANDNESSAELLNYFIDPALLPPGMTFNAAPNSRTISGTPTTPGTYTITASVSDGGTPPLSTQRTFVLQVTNKGPSWAAAANVQPPSAVRNNAYSFLVPAAVDPENQALTYHIVQGPSWLSIDPISHVLSGTPPLDPSNVGSHAVVVEAVDTFDESVRTSFTLEVVSAAPYWPTLTSPSPRHAWPSFASYTPEPAIDPEGQALTYHASGLPASLTINPANGTITGGSGQIGVFPVTLTATDPDGLSISRFITVTLTNAAPVYVTGLPDMQIVRGVYTEVALPANAFVDPDGDSISYFPSSVHPAPDLFVDFFDNVIHIQSGAATPIGSVSITIAAQDIFGVFGFRTFNLEIKAPPPPPPPPPHIPTPPPPHPGPPHSPPIAAPDEEPAVANQPIAAAPEPVLGSAPEPELTALIAPAPMQTQLLSIAPLADVLATYRPTASADDLHSFYFYDGQGRSTGLVDERGFLSETVYDAQANTQQSVRYMNAVTVAGTDTFATLKTRAGDQPSIDNDAPRVTTTAYDSFGRVSTFTEVDGTTVTRYEYDSSGRLVRQARGGAAASEQRASRMRYDAFGELTGTVGGVGDAAGLSTIEAIAQYGTRYEYDSLGRRSKAITRNAAGADLTTLYYYDAENRLTHIVSALGQVSETVYNAFGQVKEQRRYAILVRNTDANPLLNQLQAGAKGRADLLAEIATFPTGGDNQIVSYDYDRRGELTTTTDGEGFVTTNTYDSFEQLTTLTRTIRQALGGAQALTTTTQYSYDLRGELLATTADLGGLNFNQRTVYDAFGRVTQSVDTAGKVTATAYNDSGRAIDVTVDIGANGEGLNRHTRTVYDAFARVLTQIDAKGSETQYKYDDVARSIRMTTPEGISVLTYQTRFGETLSVTTGIGPTDAVGKTTNYEYDKDGRLLKVTDALGQVVSESLYEKNGLLKQTTAGGVLTTFKYDAVNRMFERCVDPDGLNLLCTYQFDALDRQSIVTEKQGAAAVRVTQSFYDRKGQLTRTTVDPEGLKLVTDFEYDGLGNTVTVTRGTLQEGGGGTQQQATLYAFDKLGRRVKEIAAPSALLGAGSARERDLTTEYRYDSAGRVSRRIDAGGQSTWYVYDAAGEINYTINAEGEVSQTFYDANGQVVQTRSYATRLTAGVLAGFGDAVGSVVPTPSDSDARSYAVYDLDGRLRYRLQAVTGGAGRNWTISENIYDAKSDNLVETRSYDKFIGEERITVIAGGSTGITTTEVRDELIALGYNATQPSTFANVRRTRFAYDKDDRLRFTVDATGAVSESVYDVAGRVVAGVRYATRPTLPSGPADVPTEAMVNDAVSRTDAANRVSRFSYDKAGRLRFSVQVLASNAQGQATQLIVSEQSEDALGRVVQTTAYASVVTGTFAEADYSADNLATKITASAVADRRSAFVYDAAGRAVYSVQVSALNGSGERLHLVSKMDYDALGQVVQSTTYATAVTLANYAKATLDSAVSVAAVANNTQNHTTRYVYDQVGRMRFAVAADGTFGETVYDAMGRVREMRQFERPVKSTTPITAAGLSAWRGARQVGDGVTRGVKYAYDRIGRMRFAVAADGSLSESIYDALGRVCEKRQFADVTVSPVAPIAEADLSTLRGTRSVGDDMTRGVKYTYDRADRVVTSTDAKNFVESYTYDALGNRQFFIDKNNELQEYGYDLLGRLTAHKTQPVMVQLDTETAPVIRRLCTSIDYDALGNLVRRTELLGTGLNERKTDYAYDRLGRQTAVTLPGWYDPGTGRVEVEQGAAALNRFQRTAQTTYDALGNDVRHAVRTGAGAGDFLYEYKTFDVRGRVVHDVDALSNVTGFTYTVFGEQRTVTRYSKSAGAPTAANGLWTANDVVTALGTDADARTVTLSYDNMGRKTDVTQDVVAGYFGPSGPRSHANIGITTVNGAAVTHYDYNAFGEVAHEALSIDNVGTDAAGRTGHWRDTWHYFDTMGRETRTIDALGYHTERSFDANGNLKQTVEYAKAGSLGTVGSAPSLSAPGTPVQDSQDRITAFSYDALNQQTTIERLGLSYSTLQGDGTYAAVNNARTVAKTVASMTYDGMGHVHTRTDALGNETRTDYNALGQVTQITEPARLVAGAAIDPFLGQVAVSPVTTMTYNGFGQVLKQVRNPGGGAGATLTISHSYDFAGNLLSNTDARGNTTKRQVDYAGRVIEETSDIDVTLGDSYFDVWQTVAHTLKRRYAYDALGRQTDVADVYQDVHWNADGSVTKTPTQSGKRSVYNAFGEVREEQRIAGAASASITSLSGSTFAHYDYDKTGRVTQKIAADGTTHYYYDLAGQLTRQHQVGSDIADNGTVTSRTRVTEISYDALGRVSLQVLPWDGFLFVFDGTVQDLGVTPFVRQSSDRWGNVVSSRQVGSIDNTTREITEGAVTTYDYNADSQVVAVHLPAVTAVRTDNSAYQSQVTHETHYDVLGRAVTEVDLGDDAATAANERTPLRLRQHQYNAAGQLTADIDATNHRTEYAYDGNGYRVGTRNGVGGVLVDVVDADGNVTRHGALRLGGLSGVYQSIGSGTVSSSGQTAYFYELNRYLYDQANRRVGSADVMHQDGDAFDWTFTQYDERNLAVAERNASRVVVRREYDALGNKSRELDGNNNGQSYFYDVANYGRLASSTIIVGGVATDRVTQYSYNGFGLLDKETRAGADNYRKYSYFANGLLKKVEDDMVLGAFGAFGTDFVADYWSTVDTATYSYDLKGERVLETFSRTGSKEEETGHWVYIPDPVDPSTGTTTWVVDGTRLVNLTAAESPTRVVGTNYDVLGRVTAVIAPAVQNPGPTVLGRVNYYYDELGNRRHTFADRNNNGQVDAGETQLWFTYDAEGRVTIIDGVQENGWIGAGVQGLLVIYDDAGRRWKTVKGEGSDHEDVSGGFQDENGNFQALVTRWTQDRTTRYVYDDLDRVHEIRETVVQSSKYQFLRTYYADGPPVDGAPTPLNDDQKEFVTAKYFYDTRGNIIGEEHHEIKLHGPNISDAAEVPKSLTTRQYRADGKLGADEIRVGDFDRAYTQQYLYDDAGMLKSYDYLNFTASHNDLILHYLYDYNVEFGGYLEAKVTVTAERQINSNATVPGKGTTDSYYDDHGQLLKRVDHNPARVSTQTFCYDVDGHLITKAESVQPSQGQATSGKQDYFYAQGHEFATLGTGTLQTEQFDLEFTPVSAAYPNVGPSNYVVNPGDSLAGIAVAVYGDAQLWYLIADANNVSFGPADLLPPTELGRTYRIPHVVANVHNNAGTFAPYNAAQMLGSSTPMPGLPPIECEAAKRILVLAVTMAVSMGVSALLVGRLGPAGVGIGAAAGDAAGQLTGWGLGLQDGIDLNHAVMTAATATVTAGIGQGVGQAIGGQATALGASAATQELIHAAQNGYQDWQSAQGIAGSLFNVGAAVAAAGLSSNLTAQVGGYNVNFARGAGMIANDAFNPQSGWFFNDRSRNWATIAGQALDVFSSVDIEDGPAGGAMSYADDDRESWFKLSTTSLSEDYAQNRGEYNRGLSAAQSDTSADTVQATSIVDDQGNAWDERGRLIRVAVPKGIINQEQLSRYVYANDSSTPGRLVAAIRAANPDFDEAHMEMKEGMVFNIIPYDDLDLGATEKLYQMGWKAEDNYRTQKAAASAAAAARRAAAQDLQIEQMAAWDTTLDTENGVSRSPGTSPAERVAAERELGDFQLQVTAEMTDFMSAQEAYFKAEVLFRKQADVLLNRLPPDPDGLGYDWPQEDYTDMVKYPIANLQDLVRYHGTIKPISQWIEHRQDDHVIYSHQGSVAWIVNGIGFVADRFIPDTEAGIVLTLVPFMPKGLKGLSRLLPEAEESLPGLLGDALPALENGGKSLLGIEDAAATNHRSLKIPFTNLQVNLPGFKIPSSTYNYDPALTGTKVMGHTLPNGDIFLRPGMTVAEETFALSHESVHSYLSVRGSGRIGDFRRALGMWGYNESAVLRYTEEAMAQGYATNSLLKALKFPIAKGYVTGTRLAIEGIGLGVGYGGSLYGSYRLGHYLGGSSTDIPGGGR